MFPKLKKQPIQQSGLVWLCLALVVVFLDQWSKLWVAQHIPVGYRLPVTAWLNWVHVHNTGIAFSLFANSAKWVFILITSFSCIVVFGLMVLLRYVPRDNPTLGILVALLMGGAAGNIIDRISLGYVIDFIDVHYRHWHWAQFNLADMAICIAAFWYACCAPLRIKI